MPQLLNFWKILIAKKHGSNFKIRTVFKTKRFVVRQWTYIFFNALTISAGNFSSTVPKAPRPLPSIRAAALSAISSLSGFQNSFLAFKVFGASNGRIKRNPTPKPGESVNHQGLFGTFGSSVSTLRHWRALQHCDIERRQAPMNRHGQLASKPFSVC